MTMTMTITLTLTLMPNTNTDTDDDTKLTLTGGRATARPYNATMTQTFCKMLSLRKN